jgi:hypothetical protein
MLRSEFYNSRGVEFSSGLRLGAKQIEVTTQASTLEFCAPKCADFPKMHHKENEVLPE